MNRKKAIEIRTDTAVSDPRSLSLGEVLSQQLMVTGTTVLEQLPQSPLANAIISVKRLDFAS